MKFAQHLLLVCLAGAVLGCGQKGPLVMPDAQKHKRTLPTLPGATKPPAGGGATPAAPSPTPPSPATAPSSSPPSTPPSTPPPADLTHS